MRKKVFGKKLNRNRRSRTALFRSLTRSMILHGKIRTTKPKALALQPDLDKLVGLVKENSLLSRRTAMARLANDREAVDILFEKYKELAGSRNSGFTRIESQGYRRGDDSPMVLLSWVLSADADEKKAEPAKGKAMK